MFEIQLMKYDKWWSPKDYKTIIYRKRHKHRFKNWHRIHEDLLVILKSLHIQTLHILFPYLFRLNSLLNRLVSLGFMSRTICCKFKFDRLSFVLTRNEKHEIAKAHNCSGGRFGWWESEWEFLQEFNYCLPRHCRRGQSWKGLDKIFNKTSQTTQLEGSFGWFVLFWE